MAKVTTTAGGSGKATAAKATKGGKAAKGKPAKKAKGTFQFRDPKSKEAYGGMKAGEFGKVRVSDLPPSKNKLAVLSTLIDKCKGSATPPDIVAANSAINGKQARHYLYHAEAGALVKREAGDDCKGTATFTITAAGRKAVQEMKKAKDLK
jgi:hypothetical protein